MKHRAHGLCVGCYSTERYRTVEYVRIKHRIRDNEKRFSGQRDVIIAIEKRCQVCNINDKLHVHHIDGNRKNNHLSNLTVLCTSCHTSLHNYLKGKERFKNHKNLII